MHPDPIGKIDIENGTIESKASVVDQIRAQRKLADMNLEEIPANTRAAFAIAKANAKVMADQMEADYLADLPNHIVLLFLEGEDNNVKSFLDLAAEVGPVIALDYDAIYKEVADMVVPTMNQSREFDVTQYTRLTEALAQICGRLGVVEMPRPAFRTAANVDPAPFVRRLVEQTFGSDLALLQIKTDLKKEAIRHGFSEIVPVVVYGAATKDHDVIKKNLVNSAARVMVHKVDSAATEESVAEVLDQMASLASR